jgi:hypothetical protein
MAELKPDVSKKTLAALEQLLEGISDPSSRRKFLKSRDTAVKKGDLPQPLIDALAELTPAELRLVSDLNTTLVESGLRWPGIKVGIV